MSQVEKRREMMNDWAEYTLRKKDARASVNLEKEIALAFLGLECKHEVTPCAGIHDTRYLVRHLELKVQP